ncbi:MAG TPA: pyruvate dehydrogenase (acetyl-transferring), homodimeric type, partial [Burkholderiales bacterium]|nr:pyruvate dehydrogenase (acetyl-transferring), homodimeric type [Burkholderiales bacterium]
DPVKIYAAYHAAVNHAGQPTVILAQTKKGYGMGHWAQGRMGAHQAKKLEDDALLAFRDRFALPISDEDVQRLRFHQPTPDSPEMRYVRARREQLGGPVPVRLQQTPALAVPALESFARLLEGSGSREESTTMVFVRALSQLLRDSRIGRHIVPIVADEARTFGMQSLFRQVAIYSPFGQLYEPEDRDELLYYKETKDGQIMEEGINEAGAMSSWIAAAASYSTHGVPMLPFYVFYSMFGFQRVGDFIWAAADSRARGFLIGATAGRTTLSGEGLQHQDGTSQLIASTIPNCRSYDPCFGYELTVILQDGARRMLQAQEDVFYYITVMNENYAQPVLPEPRDKTIDGILRGMYLLRASTLDALPLGKGGESGKGRNADARRVQLMGSGTILREVLAAAELLESQFDVAADVWSVTSFTELARDGMEVARWNRMHPTAPARVAWVETCLKDHAGPAVAATDYVRAYAEQIRGLVQRPYTVLGTDGIGRSDTRLALRAFFEVDRRHIAVAALKALADREALPATAVADAMADLGIDPERSGPWRL